MPASHTGRGGRHHPLQSLRLLHIPTGRSAFLSVWPCDATVILGSQTHGGMNSCNAQSVRRAALEARSRWDNVRPLAIRLRA